MKVTLTILTVLVGSKCKQNLDLFLVSVVNIVAKMLESPLNTEIIEQISSTVCNLFSYIFILYIYYNNNLLSFILILYI